MQVAVKLNHMRKWSVFDQNVILCFFLFFFPPSLPPALFSSLFLSSPSSSPPFPASLSNIMI